MSSNGNRKPPRPRIEMASAAASPAEAAAVIAAVERFIADTAPAPAPAVDRVNPWQRAALIEGVKAAEAAVAVHGDGSTWNAVHSD